MKICISGSFGSKSFDLTTDASQQDIVKTIIGFKESKQVTNLSSIGGSDLVVIDWKKISVVEVV